MTFPPTREEDSLPSLPVFPLLEHICLDLHKTKGVQEFANMLVSRSRAEFGRLGHGLGHLAPLIQVIFADHITGNTTDQMPAYASRLARECIAVQWRGSMAFRDEYPSADGSWSDDLEADG